MGERKEKRTGAGGVRRLKLVLSVNVVVTPAYVRCLRNVRKKGR